MKRFFIMLLVLAMVFSLITGCSQTSSTEDAEAQVIKIGLVGPWSGPSAENGESMRRGAELAVQDINANGGLKGYEVELVAYDDQSVPEESVNAVTKMITQDEVLAIVGAFNSACTLANMEVSNREQVPQITPISMADDINREDDFIFRNTLGNIESAEVVDNLVDDPSKEMLLTDATGSKKVAVLWENDDWGKGLSDSVVDTAKALGQEDSIVASVPYNLGTTDFYPTLTSVLEKDPDIIYMVSLATEAIQIVKQARELGYEGIFMGEGGFNAEEFDATLGELAYGCLFFAQWHEDFDFALSKQFFNSYKVAYPDSAPDMFSAITYEAVYIIKDSIERAEDAPEDLATWRVNVRDAMASLKGFGGVSGTISFNEVGQCFRPIFVLQKSPDGAQIVLPKDRATSEIRRDLGVSAE